jgi:uncharacterized integral membrane protein
MKRIFNFLVILVVVVLAMLFGKLNPAPVDVDFFFVPPISGWPLGFWLLLFFLIGMLLAGLLVYVQLWFSLRRRMKVMRREQQSAATATGQGDAPRLEADSDD